MKNLQFIVVVLLFSTVITNAGLVAGRSIPDGRDAGLTLRMGQVASLEADVKDSSSSFLRQDFSLSDLGIEGGYITYGFSADKAWKFFGVQLDFLYFTLSEGITAQQSYDISIDSFADYLHVEANTEIKAEFTGGLAELHGLFTPISFQISESLSFTPWASLGITVLAGNYDIDNGKSTATVSYGPLSESYSVGGSASGPMGFIVPDIGFGGEVRIGAPDDFNFVVNGNYSFLPMSENLGKMLSEQSESTDVTINYKNIKINGFLEIPYGDNGKAWTVGVQYEEIDASSDMKLDGGLFNKSVDLNITIITGSVGMRF